MNVKDKVVTIKDLRNIGRLGGATARLLDGTDMELLENYGVVRREGVVFGKLETVEVVERYVAIYPKIRTIKWNNIIVARLVKRGNKELLELTGNGYRREKL